MDEKELKEYPIVFIGLRVDTYPGMDIPSFLTAFRSVLKPFGDVAYATYGLETAKKTKKEHFHYHLGLQPTENSIPFKKVMSSYVYRNWKGAAFPSCKKAKSITHPEQSDDFPTRWFSYPLKDYPDFKDVPIDLCLGFSELELKEMYYVASAERKAADVKLEKYENKLNNDKQSRALLWEWLDNELPNLGEKKFRKSKATGELVLVDPILETSMKIVEYNRLYNDYRIPMDLQRRTISYLSYRGVMTDEQIAKHILKY